MNMTQWIAIIGIFAANGVTLIAFFMKMKVDIAEINERYISIQKELTEHKEDNRTTNAEIKNLLAENKKDNREDHNKLFDKLEKVSMQVINATNTFINAPRP